MRALISLAVAPLLAAHPARAGSEKAPLCLSKLLDPVRQLPLPRGFFLAKILRSRAGATGHPARAMSATTTTGTSIAWST